MRKKVSRVSDTGDLTMVTHACFQVLLMGASGSGKTSMRSLILSVPSQ